jgi:tRNA(Ile)-lysidine synthase
LNLKEELGIEKIAACHVNHNLRGEESERDELFCQNLCRELGVPLIVKRVEIKRKGRSLEEAAREERYKALSEALAKWKGDLIATGHTASDLVETILLNLSKGTGIRGLRGFLPKRGKIIRPLYECTRAEIEEYLRANDIPFVLDSSNLSTELERNLLRLEVIPHLKRINPSLEKGFLRTSKILAEAQDFIDSQVSPLLAEYLADGEFKIPLKRLLSLHPFLRKQLLARAYEEIAGRTLSFEKLSQVEKILRASGFKRLQPDKGYEIVKEQEHLRIKREGKKPEPIFVKVKDVPLKLETEAGTLFLLLNEGSPVADLEEVRGGRVVVRTRREGDRVRFKGFSKSLKKLMSEKRISPEARWQLPIVEVGGEIRFVPNLFLTDKEFKKPFVGVKFEKGK